MPTPKSLTYINTLKKAGNWPPKRKKDGNSGKPGSVATPYLVVQAGPSDLGMAPRDPATGWYNGSILLLSPAGAPELAPTAGINTVECVVHNFGLAPAWGGMVNFFAASQTEFDAMNHGSSLLPKLIGRIPFQVQPGCSVAVKCPWNPDPAHPERSSILVQAYDLLLDPLTASKAWDSLGNRQVGRLDCNTDFVGTWEGRLVFLPGRVQNLPGAPTRVVVRQNGLGITGVEVFGQANGQWEATPYSAFTSGVVSGRRANGSRADPTHTDGQDSFSFTLQPNGTMQVSLNKTSPPFLDPTTHLHSGGLVQINSGTFHRTLHP